MLEVIQFKDTLRYGIRNTITGHVLVKQRTKGYPPYSYRSKRRAIRKAQKLIKRLDRTVRTIVR